MKPTEHDARIITRMLEDIQILRDRVEHFDPTAQSFARPDV